jgi:hypothetical protein
MFRARCWQVQAEFDCSFEFFGVKRQAEDAVCAGFGEVKFPFRSNRKGDHRHFARRSELSNLSNGFDDALRAGFETWSWEEIVGSEDHYVEIFAACVVCEFVDASSPGRIDAGAVIAEIENKDFNQIANTAIRMANQKVERFHQFVEIPPPCEMGDACLRVFCISRRFAK